MRRAGAAFITGIRRIYLSVDRISALEVVGNVYKMPGRWSMGDVADASDRPHIYKYTSVLEVPAAHQLQDNEQFRTNVVADLRFRIREVESMKLENERLRLLNIRLNVPNFNAPAPPPPAPAGDEATRITDLEGQLQASVEENKLQKGLLDEEKGLFAAARVLASDPGIHVETDEVVALKDRIERQEAMIEHLTERVRHWRELCESGTSSTNSNVLQNLLDQLQNLLQLSLDDPGRVYTAVVEAIYENTSPAQRDTIDDAPSNKTEWIGHIAELLQYEQSEQSEHRDASDASESGAGEPDADGIELAARPESARTKKGYTKATPAEPPALLSPL